MLVFIFHLDHLEAVIAVLELVLSLTLFDVVFEQFWDLDGLMAVVTSRQELALLG